MQLVKVLHCKPPTNSRNCLLSNSKSCWESKSNVSLSDFLNKCLTRSVFLMKMIV